ncbi:MAG: hypothetical protein ABI462_06775 [Ignavibacteria bacterium]
MKKIFCLLVMILICDHSSAQVKRRSVSSEFYTGVGYKFVFLTNPDARDAYPFFQLSNGDFLKEIDGYFGVTINGKYGIELSPAYLFTNALNSDGFSFTDNLGTRFYVPVDTRLFAVPINLKLKFYPFASGKSETFSKMYFGIGGGAMYIEEEVTSQIYTDDTRFNYIGTRHYDESSWTSNYEILLGIGNFSKIGYGFELSYRIVPLKHLNNKPLITDVASNFNSVNLSANIIFSF